jgi:sec-independent protein translocase protein TatB
VFGIEWTEYAVIAIVALIVIGPKELPAVLRAIGQWTTKIRRMAAEFQGQFQEALREAEMADLKKEIDDATRGFNSQFEDPLNFKEGTKWEPKPDPAKPDDIKPDAATSPAEVPSTQASQESASVATAPRPDPPPQATEGEPVYPPLNASHGTVGEESFPIAADDHSAIEQTLAVPSPAGTGGSRVVNGGGAAEAAAAPPITPPLAQPPLPEGSGQGRSEGGVHS